MTGQALAGRVALADKKGFERMMRHFGHLAAPQQEAEVVVVQPAQEWWFIQNGIPYKLASLPPDTIQ